MVLYLEKITTSATISSSSISSRIISVSVLFTSRPERDAVRGQPLTNRPLPTNSSHRKPYPTCRKHRDPYPGKFIQGKNMFPVLSDDRGFVSSTAIAGSSRSSYALRTLPGKEGYDPLWLLVRQIRFDLPEAVPVQMWMGKYMYRYYIRSRQQQKGVAMAEDVAEWLAVYNRPEALSGFIPKRHTWMNLHR